MRITLREANEILEAMLKYATETKPGKPMTFAVGDEVGALVGLVRMDAAPPMGVRMVENKIYTAIQWGRDTKEIWLRFQNSADIRRDIAWYGDPRYTPNPGGVLLRAENGEIVGAVASSGRTAEEDEELPQVGAKTYREMLNRKKVK